MCGYQRFCVVCFYTLIRIFRRPHGNMRKRHCQRDIGQIPGRVPALTCSTNSEGLRPTSGNTQTSVWPSSCINTETEGLRSIPQRPQGEDPARPSARGSISNIHASSIRLVCDRAERAPRCEAAKVEAAGPIDRGLGISESRIDSATARTAHDAAGIEDRPAPGRFTQPEVDGREGLRDPHLPVKDRKAVGHRYRCRTATSARRMPRAAQGRLRWRGIHHHQALRWTLHERRLQGAVAENHAQMDAQRRGEFPLSRHTSAVRNKMRFTRDCDAPSGAYHPSYDHARVPARSGARAMLARSGVRMRT